MARVYDTKKWLRLRRHKLRQNPLCEMCLKQGRLEVATVVDHIVGVNKGGQAYPTLDGLM